MDPSDHPDLRHLAARLDEQLGDVLEAEHHAARVTAQRRTSLRDRLIRAEDMMAEVAVTTTTGRYVGVMKAVGTDHVIVADPTERVLAIHHIVVLEVAS